MASGDCLHRFSAEHNQPPATAYATRDTRNQHPVLDYDAGSTERGVFGDVFDPRYDGGGLTVRLHVAWSSDTNVAHKSRFDVGVERIGAAVQDLDADGFAAAQSVSITVVATSGHVAVGTVTFTDGAQMDSLAVGEKFRIYVDRDHDHADDDATGDTELCNVEVRET
jgi:hypothetical protein